MNPVQFATTGLTRLSTFASIRSHIHSALALHVHVFLHTGLPSVHLRYLAPRSRSYTESSWQAQELLVPVRRRLHNSCTVVLPWPFFELHCHLCLV